MRGIDEEDGTFLGEDLPDFRCGGRSIQFF
jgi:hypothetical protein